VLDRIMSHPAIKYEVAGGRRRKGKGACECKQASGCPERRLVSPVLNVHPHTSCTPSMLSSPVTTH
jgi:hypothetical protein